MRACTITIPIGSDGVTSYRLLSSAGATQRTAISISIATAATMTRGRRPTRSASAPAGRSVQTMAIAHAKFSRVYCVALRPRSRKSTARNG